MRIKYIVLSMVFLLNGYVIQSNAAGDSSGLSDSSADKAPKWVYSPEKFCKKHELCAVGIAGGLNMAEASARAGVAKVFKTKISSKFQQSIASTDGDVSQNLSEQIEEEVNEVIEGIEIRKSHEGPLEVYALAVLDKRKASKRHRSEIKGLDEKMKTLYQDSSPRSAGQLFKIAKKREILNARLEFLSGGAINPPVTFSQIFKKRKAATKGKRLFVSFTGSDDQLAPFVIATLTDLNYLVLKKDKASATHTVVGSFTSKKETMNVEGFEKYSFILNLSAQKIGGAKSGGLQYTTTQVGRDSEQALYKALSLVKDYINNNIADLNIE